MAERAASPPCGKRGRALRRLGYGVYLCVTILLGTELLLRWLDPIGMSYAYEVRRYFDEMMIPDERFAYIHKPGLVTTVQGVGVSINSYGFRGPEFAAEPPANRIRMMILGDSVVFGWGVERDATFPTLLQIGFDRLGIPVDIVASGVGSWNTRTQHEWLRHIGVKLAPDVVVLIIVANDTDPNFEGVTEVGKNELSTDASGRSLLQDVIEFARFVLRASYLATHLNYYWEKYLLVQRSGSIDQSSPQWRDARLALDGLIDLCRQRGIELIVYLYGSEALMHSYRSLTLYREHLALRGIRPLATPAAVAQAEFHNSPVDPHLNAAGHAILAAAMLETLAPRLTAIRPQIASGAQSRVGANDR